MSERHLTLCRHPQRQPRKSESQEKMERSVWKGMSGSGGCGAPPGHYPGALPGVGSPSSPGWAWGASLFPSFSASPSALSSWLFPKLQQSWWSCWRAGACHHPGLGAPRLAAGHQGPEGLETDLVIRLQQELEGIWGGEGCPWETLDLSSGSGTMWSCGFAKGDTPCLALCALQLYGEGRRQCARGSFQFQGARKLCPSG